MIKLLKFDIKFQSRPSIKAQILTDFLIECTISNKPTESEATESSELMSSPPSSLNSTWEIYVNESSNSEGSVVIINPERIITVHGLCLKFSATNNEVEYETLLEELEINKELEVQDLRVYSDSVGRRSCRGFRD